MGYKTASLAALCAALLLTTQSTVLADPAQATTSDVWDVNQGASNHVSPGGSLVGAPANAFGGTSNGGSLDQFIFPDNPGNQILEWQTANPATIEEVGIFFQHDGSDVNNRRAVTLTLSGRSLPFDPYTTILTVQLSANTFNAVYGGGEFSSQPTDFFSILPVDLVLPEAQYFRAEITPFSATSFPGVRVFELDGIVPEPASGLTALALATLALVRRRRQA